LAAKRDEKGRFIKGEVANPKGRPPRATEEEYAETFREVIPLERWKRMIERQALRADKGDLIAFKALVLYLAGAPTQKSELTGKDGERFVVNLSWGDDIKTNDD